MLPRVYVCVRVCVCVCVYVCMCAKFIQLSVCICRCVRSVHVPRHVVQSLLDKMCHLQGHRRNAECMLRLAHVGSLLSHAIGQKSGPEKRVVWRTFFSDGASAPQGWIQWRRRGTYALARGWYMTWLLDHAGLKVCFTRSVCDFVRRFVRPLIGQRV